MSIRKVNLVNNEYYHVFNRGNSKQKIFHDNEDCFHFMGLMFACNSENNFRMFGLGVKETYYSIDSSIYTLYLSTSLPLSLMFYIILTLLVVSCFYAQHYLLLLSLQ